MNKKGNSAPTYFVVSELRRRMSRSAFPSMALVGGYSGYQVTDRIDLVTAKNASCVSKTR